MLQDAPELTPPSLRVMEGNMDSSTPALVHSEATKKYLGKLKNKNTDKNEKQALRTWFRLCSILICSTIDLQIRNIS